MIVDALTTFPEMLAAPLSCSIMGRAQAAGKLAFTAYDLRDWTHDRHRTTDDQIYGGGQGLLMKPDPVFDALDDLQQEGPAGTVIFFSPAGRRFDQAMAGELSRKERLIFVCGHYEGMDERVYSRADLVISLGDFVLTGGEMAALAVIDATVRLVPGVLGDAASPVEESFSDGLLEFPQYTRPADCRGLAVPSILLSGDHAKVDAWRRRQSLRRTALLRPDLLDAASLSDDERDFARQVAERHEYGEQDYIDYTARAVRGEG